MHRSLNLAGYDKAHASMAFLFPRFENLQTLRKVSSSFLGDNCGRFEALAALNKKVYSILKMEAARSSVRRYILWHVIPLLGNDGEINSCRY
jgi:hypothetical protein